MNLAIDIGNTFTHVGLFANNKLSSLKTFRTSSKNKLKNVLGVLIKRKKIDIIGISSVVKEMNLLYMKYLNDTYEVNPIFISGKLKLPIRIKINNLKRLGADRICNAVFAYNYFKKRNNVIIIDSGTAITYDVVLKNGDFIGGIISPGIGISSLSLSQYTSLLPLLKLKEFKIPLNPVGRNTKEALTSGIIFTAVDSIDGMISRIKNHFKIEFKVILTGGNSKLLYSQISHRVIFKKNCALYGINQILNFSNEG